MSTPVIQVEGLSKRYKMYPSPGARLVEWMSWGRAVRHTDFWALRDFNLTMNAGECVGIIGANGAGKSTLLKLLSRTITPTTGSFSLKGNVLSLLELGGGFSPDLTGRQNVIEAASLLGFPAGHVQQRLNDIMEFAQLGEFFDRPMRMYSSGMNVRLAFSMYAFFDPDILIVDEALAVGDAAFQRKCFRRIQELVENDRRAAILVSHDMQSMIKFCNRIHWLDKGKERMVGEPGPVVREYLRFMLSTENALIPVPKNVPRTRVDLSNPIQSERSVSVPIGALSRSPAAMVYDPDGVELLGVWLELGGGQTTALVPVEKPFALCYALRFAKKVFRPVFGIQITTPRGECMVGTNTKMMRTETGEFEQGQSVIVRWPIGPGLTVADYFISCGCSLDDDLYHFLMREVDGYQFSVTGPWKQSGLCSLNGQPEIEKIS